MKCFSCSENIGYKVPELAMGKDRRNVGDLHVLPIMHSWNVYVLLTKTFNKVKQAGLLYKEERHSLLVLPRQEMSILPEFQQSPPSQLGMQVTWMQWKGCGV